MDLEPKRINPTISGEHCRKLELLGEAWRFRTSRAVEECIDIAWARESKRLGLTLTEDVREAAGRGEV